MKRKRLISGIMALALVSAIVPYSPIVANADTTYIINQVDHKCGDNATWSFDETTGTLTISGTGDMYDDMCNFFSQTWFSKNVTNTTTTNEVSDFLVKNLVIEDGITSIGDWVFSSFNNLENVSLPDTLTTIGEYAFYCFKYGGVKLNSITIPKYVNSIGDKAFGYYEYTYSDENNDLQYGMEKIEDFTIKGYRGSQAETYANANGITFIALDDDKDITDNKCGDNATWSLDEATGTLTISGTGDTYDYTMNTAPFDYNGQIDIEANIKKIVVEDGITSLGDCIFFTDAGPLRNVESISLPESLVRIGNNSIAGFTESLKEINIPNNLKSIGDNAFLKWEDDYSANPIKSMTIPKSVESIGKYAIGYVEGDGATFNTEDDFIIKGYKGSQAETYANANGITFIALDDDKDITDNKCGDNATWSFDDSTGTLTISGTGDMYDYNNLYGDEIEGSDFAPWYDFIDKIESVVIEDGITYISEGFLGCYNLTSLTIPNSVTSIGYMAFRGCTSLKSVTIPKTVTEIKEHAFGFAGEDDIIEGFTIYGYTGSEAEKYVNTANNNSFATNNNKITFVALDEEEPTNTTTPSDTTPSSTTTTPNSTTQPSNDSTTTPNGTTQPSNDSTTTPNGTTQPSNDSTTTAPKDDSSAHTGDGMGVLPLLTATGLVGTIAYLLRKKR